MLTGSSSQYGTNGLILASTDAEGRKTYCDYDEESRMTGVGINDATTTMEYDSRGRLIERTSPLGNTTEYAYGPTGQTRRVTQYLDVSGSPVAVTTTFDYDGGGYGSRLVAVRDAKNQKTGYKYDPWGRLASEIIYTGTSAHSEHAKARYEYDAMGRVLAATSFSRIPTKFEYDDLGRLRYKRIWRNDPLIQDATGVKITNHYNALGQLAHVHIDDASGCGCAEDKWYGYDAHGRMSEHTGVVGGATLTYSYDDFGQLAGFDYPKDPANWASKAGLDYTYDLLGRMATVDDNGAGDPLARFTYNKASEVTKTEYDNGAYTEYEYDGYGRVALVENHAEDDSVMSAFRYSYNLDGLRTRVDREDGKFLTYEYDTLNRLTRERKFDDVKATSLEFDGSDDYVTVARADEMGIEGLSELTLEAWVRTSDVVDVTQTIINNYGHFGIGILDGVFTAYVITVYGPTYLTSGALSEDTWYHVVLVFDAPNEEVRLYVNGSLAASDYNAYTFYTSDYTFALGGEDLGTYPPDDRFFKGRVSEVRVSSTVRDVTSLYGAGVYNKPLQSDADTIGLWHLDGSNGDTIYDAGPHGYNGPGQLGQIVKATVWDYTSTPTATDYYYGYDILGNVSVISNNSGTEVDQFEQDAFGNEVESSWSSPVGGITEHLTTKQYDADLVLYYFNARWYDSMIGAFLSFDPSLRAAARTNGCNKSDLSPPKVDEAGDVFLEEQIPYNVAYGIGYGAPTTYVDPTGLISKTLADHCLKKAYKQPDPPAKLVDKCGYHAEVDCSQAIKCVQAYGIIYTRTPCGYGICEFGIGNVMGVNVTFHSWCCVDCTGTNPYPR